MARSIFDISLVSGWLPFALITVTAICAVYCTSHTAATVLRTSPTRPHAARRCITALSAVVASGAAGATITWLISDVFVLFGVPLEPSTPLFVGIAFALVALGICTLRLHAQRRWQRILAAAVIPCALLTSALSINMAYGEYTTLGSLFGRSPYQALRLQDIATHTVPLKQWRQRHDAQHATARTGMVGTVSIPSSDPRFNPRQAVVYVPPAALQRECPPLPVLIMLSGQPGSPNRSMSAGHFPSIMNAYAAAHKGLSPIVVAVDQLGNDWHNTLCVDSSLYGNVETYLTHDVPRWIMRHLPVADQASQWALGGFSQGATCTMQIGPTYPHRFGMMIAVGSELGPSNGSPDDMIRSFFNGNTADYRAHIPVNAIRLHAPSTQTLIMAAGERDSTGQQHIQAIAPTAQTAGMNVTTLTAARYGHDWHSVRATFRYAIPVFMHKAGYSGAPPSLKDFPDLHRLPVSNSPAGDTTTYDTEK